MSKRLKTVTKVIALLLSVIMVYEISPTNAIAAYVTNINVQANGEEVARKYDESYNFFYDSHSIDVGRAGTLKVNDYTLQPSLEFKSLSINGNICPVNIWIRYNSAEYRFLKDITGYAVTAYGRGWLTNYSCSLCEIQYEDELQIAYLTGSGSVIMFKNAELLDNDLDEDLKGITKWVPAVESFKELSLYRFTDEYASTENMIIDETQIQYIVYANNSALYYFDNNGRLIYCEDIKREIGYHIKYNSNMLAETISKITDGIGNEFRFEYTDGFLTKIKCYTPDGTEIIAGSGDDAAPLEMNFSYKNDNLTSVTFPDGKSITYKYNSRGDLTTVTDIDGHKVELSYTGEYVSKISEFMLDENGSYVAGKWIDISWDGNTRTFEDNNGNIQIKTFDDNGKIISIVDGDGNYLYDSSTDEEDSTGSLPEEDLTHEPFISICPCENCPEWECICECESEEVCICIQCKRKTVTVEDENGNILAEESFDGKKTMKKQKIYTDDGNYLASTVDTWGNTVYYIYDDAGFLNSISSGDMEILLEHDAVGNLTRLSQNVSGLSNGSIMSNQYTYTDDKVTSITHNGFSYNFTYDEWGNQTEIKINDTTLISYEYDGKNNDRLSKITYANGQSVTYTYDDKDNIVGTSYDGGVSNIFEYEYNTDGELIKVTDNYTGYVTTYTDCGYEIRTLDDNSIIFSSIANEDGSKTENVLGSSITYTYNNEYNQVTGKFVSTKSYTKETLRENNKGDVINSVTDVKLAVTTDWFGRTTDKSISVDTDIDTNGDVESSYVVGKDTYIYDDTDDTASTKVLSHSSTFESYNIKESRTDNYEYDKTGNITGIFRYVDGVKTYYYTYKYDEAGQLVREDILEDNKTILYVYDVGGNIVSKTEYEYTLGDITEEMSPLKASNFSYDDPEWKDLLTNFSYNDFTSSSGSDDIDTSITYDAMGNITSFNGTTFEWNAGRQLVRTVSGNVECYYYYNENGMLTREETYTNGQPDDVAVYTWDGDVFICKTIIKPNNSNTLTSRAIYDSNGETIGFIAEAPGLLDSDVTFLYRKNLQGDVTALVGTNGVICVEFTYDAYGVPNIHIPGDNDLGKVLLAIIGFLLTPQLYRGYVFSTTGCYYLGSRYYNPQLGRFMNADKYTDTEMSIVGTNMFAYCNNNPIMYTDPKGEDALTSALLIGIFLMLCFEISVMILSPYIVGLFPMVNQSDVEYALETIFTTFTDEYKKFKNVVKTVTNAMSDYLALAIGDILVKSKMSTLNKTRKDLHHIVAKKDSMAFLGRQVLKYVNIDVEDSCNKVSISYRLHAHLHTNAYHMGVGLLLSDIYKNTTNGNYKERVKSGLLLIKVLLLSASYALP